MGVSRHLLLIFISVSLAYSQDYRLPKTVSPSRYVVNLFIPHEVFTGDNTTFEGEVTMTFTVTETTSQIKLHHRVNVTNYTLVGEDGDIPVTGDYNLVTEFFTLNTSTNLTPGFSYNLNIIYHATFESTAMRGFYTSTYKRKNGTTAYLVTTQFQPTSARHAFPCLDEPQYKAIFVISLTYPEGLTALSNTNTKSMITVDGGYIKSTYKETTTMSTYLIAFIISEFTCTEGDSIASGVPHRVCSRVEEVEERKFAVEIGPPLLRSLESMTGIKFGEYMPKMDQVAIPDFSAGAMENWGLVTYRERGILYNEEDTSAIYKKNLALVVAHEFTHMWFGNLVTCKWWDYTFLNEGFARFYQYFASAVTQQFVDWQLEKHFVVEQVHTALLADSTANAQQLTSKCANSTEVSAKFGTISYNKGASIFRMIETNIMGSSNFVYGLRDYLSLNQLTGTEPQDLWTSLAKFVPISNLPAATTLETVLENWVEYNGHPVVKVSVDRNDIVLTQERFLFSSEQNSERTYYVPITYTLSNDTSKFSNTTVKTWLTPKEESVILKEGLNNSSWIILNNRQSGYYRVDYDDTLRNNIISQLHSNHLVIDVLNRAQIISDAYNFAKAGRTGGYAPEKWNFRKVFKVLTYLHHEVDYFPWYATIIGNNDLLTHIGYDSDEGKLFTSFMLNLMKEVYSTVPFETLDPNNQVYSMKQALILSKVCQYGEKTCINNAKKIFAEYREKGTKVPKDLKTTVYCNALRYSDDINGDYQFLWKKYTETDLSTEILTIYLGLGCTQDITLLKQLLGQTIDEAAGIRVQDFTTVWSYVYTSSKNGTNAALEYITENYAKLNDTYASVGSLISTIASYIYDEDQLEKLDDLANIEIISDAHKTIVEDAKNSAITNIKKAKTLKEDVRTFLEEYERENGGTKISKSSFAIVAAFLLVQKWLF
ncbi:membrane alanyl aminopeptidase-like [Euwallacea fornicatus]|uniref:membrane alanyl aminopeptidase-like n=1 Tax=Euwallacea fornicatus TaxID=995702 RepID=UPI00338D6487